VFTFGSLFTGIGGFDLGFERAGLECKWQVEIDTYCQQVLWEHWPNISKWDDVRTFPPDFSNEWNVDVICAGFPCQPFSCAGKMLGADDERNLWPQTIRIIRVLRPSIVVLENVPALLANEYFGTILADLAACGFDAEWDCLPAFAFGAPHYRDRLFIVAYSERGRLEGGIFGCGEQTAIKPPANRGTSFGTYLGTTWGDEPCISVLDDGLSGQLAEAASRLTGNAVVPDAVEWIGKRIVESFTP
jgi:DNA (cytosine-5)-methyltransferase 1